MPKLADWIPIVAPVATVVAAAIALRPAYLQFKLKVREDQRLAESARAEIDVRLLTLFTDLMAKAHARGKSEIVNEAVTSLLEGKGPGPPGTLADMQEMLRACTVTHPVGQSEQEAAIAAIGELGVRYPVLREPALAAVRQIVIWHPQSNAAQRALARLSDETDAQPPATPN